MKKQLIIFLLGAVCSTQAQDPQLNNQGQALVSFNPSFAGSVRAPRNQTNYRCEWPSSSQTNVTYANHFDFFVKYLVSGFALGVISDDQGRGTLRTTGVSLAVAPCLEPFLDNRIHVIPSVQGSYNQSTLDKGRLNFGDMINSRYGVIWNNSTAVPSASLKYFDVSAGLLVNFCDHFNFGVSCANLLQPNVSHLGEYKLPIRTTAHGSYRVLWGPRTAGYFTSFLVLQKNYYNYCFNLTNKYAGLNYGLGYGVNNKFYVYPGDQNRKFHNIIGTLGYETWRFRVTYTYNQLIQDNFFQNPSWSHEIGLAIIFRKKS